MTGAGIEHTDEIDPISTTRPYRPNWLDYLSDWAEGLLCAGLVVLPGRVGGHNRGRERGQVERRQLSFRYLRSKIPGTPCDCIYVVPLVQYIDKAAASAVDSFRPVLALNDEEFRLLRYRLTTMSWLRTLLISVAASITGPLLVRIITGLDLRITFRISNTTYGALVDLGLAGLPGWCVAAVVYHTFRQLGLMSDILTHYTQIDLYETQSLYTFSNVTARTAICLLIPTYAWVLVGLGGWVSWVGLTATVVYTIIGISLFVWPLLGVHRLLEKEKHRLQIEAARRMKSASADLHHRLDMHDLGGVTDLKDAMEGLVHREVGLGHNLHRALASRPGALVANCPPTAGNPLGSSKTSFRSSFYNSRYLRRAKARRSDNGRCTDLL